MHKIPDSLIIGGFKFELRPVKDGEEPGPDMTKSVIFYRESASNDYTVTEILGYVLTIMLDMNGLLPAGRSKKINVDSVQLLKTMQNYFFCFLRDNPIDWRMIALNVQLLEEMKPEVFPDLVIGNEVVEGPSLDETASEAVEAIGQFDYDLQPDGIQDTIV